jgi:hypothetical protein
MCGCNKNKTNNVDTGHRGGSRTNAVSIPTVDTSIWGPPLWTALHVAAQFTGDSTPWSSILSAMTTGLPCPDCSAHYNDWYRRQQPPPPPPPLRSYRPMPYLSNRRQPPSQPSSQPPSQPITIQLLGLHNEVNQRLGKPIWSEGDLNATYGGDRGSRKADAIAALQPLNTFIGQELYNTLLAFLQSL